MNKGFRNLIVVSGAIISVFTALSTRSQIELYNNLTLKKNTLEQELAFLESDIHNLNYELELVNTEEYMEKVAREKLGYIKPNEFIFREKE